MSFLNRIPKSVLLASVVIFLMLFAGLNTGLAQSLPGAASSGGSDPERGVPDIPVPKAVPQVYIPPVIDRPLGVDEGIQINVNQFEFTGLEDIDPETVNVTMLIELITAEKKLPGIFTIGQLQLAADKVATFLRQKEYILAQAFIPEQTVENGEVTVQILVGKLGSIEVEGNESYSDKVVMKPFVHELDKPVTKDGIETAMMYVMDYPGMDITGVFSRGDEVGETRLTLKVPEEDPYEFSLSGDNFGSQFSGEYRLRLDAAWNNPIGWADKLSATIMQGFEPMEISYGAVDYETPFFDHRYKIGLGSSYSQYGIVGEFEPLGIDGTVSLSNLWLERTFINQRDLGLSAGIDFARKFAETQQNNEQANMEDNLSVLSGKVSFEATDNFFDLGGISLVDVGYSHGFKNFLGAMGEEDEDASRQGGSGQFAGGEFDKVEMSVIRLQSIMQGFTCLLRAEGQWSNDMLVSLEQFSLSGPDRVRSYAPAELMRDKAWFASMEFMLNSSGFYDKIAFKNYTWSEILQLSVFVDYADGRLNDPLGNETDDPLFGAGIGVRFSLPGKFFANFTAAKPFGAYDTGNSDDGDIQYYISSTFYF
jgi:hemolysin activation/secretion protein